MCGRPGNFVDGRAVQLALREVQGHLADPRTLGVVSVAGVLLGLAGPFGTFETLEVLPRIVYWLATALLTYGLGYGISMVADAAWGEGRPLWRQEAAQAALLLAPSLAALALTATIWRRTAP